MKKQIVWVSDDGTPFNSPQEATKHELDLEIANELMDKLGYSSNVADRVARDFKEIEKIAKAAESKSKQKDNRSQQIRGQPCQATGRTEG